MRMTPVAIASVANDALLRSWAIEQAHITHHHPLSDIACVLVGRLLHGACIGHSLVRLRALADRMLVRCPAFQFSPNAGECSAYVVDTMKTALHHFFATRSFSDCLIGTVNAGGDSDTAGAIVGAIAGAFYGMTAIPERWILSLKPGLVSELERLAKLLVDLSPLANGAPVPEFAQWLEYSQEHLR
jgi:ADP-ribosyl-[dinitrogen reductase] hydrolase